ncbi:hypothetical protein BGZ99_000187 [Dissophora globulifera]|uniref:FAD-binding domain-containing protein n=1 Tax=Dissophora globulifera TaxID=979702 RepID=A0A9P6R3X1_9FUNG|nr:hypothetical protein BGZ99_000187 [Dissophora globulifera]
MSLYELMLSQLAPANILKGKKILSYEENELGITVCCADDSTYCGDILVGADGTHSRIRQILHKNLSNRGLLTKADREHNSPVYVCAAGVAPAQSPEKYPFLKDPYVHFCDVLGSNGMGWSTVNIPDNQICWSLWMQLDMKNVAKVHQEFENPEFVAADTEPIVREFRNRPCPHGGTMGDLIDATPDALKSRAYIGEKMYDTWHHGRTVLLGDGRLIF